jgi:hypothetical protein
VIQAVATKQGETEVSTQGVVHADVSFGQPTELHISHAHFPPSSASPRPYPYASSSRSCGPFFAAPKRTSRSAMCLPCPLLSSSRYAPYSMSRCASQHSKQPSRMMRATSHGLAVLSVDERHTERLDDSMWLAPRHWREVSFGTGSGAEWSRDEEWSSFRTFAESSVLTLTELVDPTFLTL